MNSDLRSYETFFWVAQLGSFSRAAEKLNTTQPAVSQRVAGLENQLGIALLERAGRRITVTPKGRELCEHMERLLHLVEEMKRAVRSPANRPGYARLGVDETLAHTWLSAFVQRLHERHPQIALDIQIDTSPRLREALAEGRIDLAFMMGAAADFGAPGFGLCRYPLGFVASPDLEIDVDEGRLCASTDVLVRHTIITYPRSTFAYSALNELLKTSSQPRPLVHSVSSISVMTSMIRDGLGVGFLPPAAVAGDLEKGALRVLETGASLPDLNFAAAIHAQADRSFLEAVVRMAQVVIRDRQRRALDNLPLWNRITINNFVN